MGRREGRRGKAWGGGRGGEVRHGRREGKRGKAWRGGRGRWEEVKLG